MITKKVGLAIAILFIIIVLKLCPISPDIPAKQFSQASAQLDYSRVPQKYWEHRIKMIKAMGPKAISTYIMWNHHEISRGVFDYSSNGKNLTYFLELVKENQMKLWLRPGPYIGGQWDFGGLPSRLLSIANMHLRENNHIFLDEVQLYFNSLAPIILPYTKGENPLIQLLQIQNEVAFVTQDREYIKTLSKMWKDLGITTLRYQVDVLDLIKYSQIDSIGIGISNHHSQLQEDRLKATYPNSSFVLFGEFYAGWMNHWGDQKLEGKDTEFIIAQAEKLLNRGTSFCIYMGAGGTNFGLTSGANGLPNRQIYNGHITSYDWGSPISEQGAPTDSYYAFRNLFLKYYSKKNPNWQYDTLLPQIPDPIPLIDFPEISVTVQATVLDNLNQQFLKDINYLPFFQSEEMSMHHQGLVVYETYLQEGFYRINADIRDYAVILVNNQFKHELDRAKNYHQEFVLQCNQGFNRIQIIVEAMGHANFGQDFYYDVKGMINFKATRIKSDKLKFIETIEPSQNKNTHWREIPNSRTTSWTNIDNVSPKSQSPAQSWPQEIVPKQYQTLQQKPDPIPKWSLFQIHLKDPTKLFAMNKIGASFPTLFKAEVELTEIGDTFLNMKRYHKGYVWINGHNLGRYWHIGPQKQLFVPGAFLKIGKNTIMILDLLKGSQDVDRIWTSKKSDRQLQKEKQLIQDI